VGRLSEESQKCIVRKIVNLSLSKIILNKYAPPCACTEWPKPIWIKVKKCWLLISQHQSTYPRGPESALIEIPTFTQIYLVKVPLNVNIVKQDLLCKTQFLKLIFKWYLKGGISIYTDSGLLGYVLWCCGSRSQDFFTFIQIYYGHTVLGLVLPCAQRYKYRVLQTIQIKLILLCVWPELAVSGSTKTALKFKYEI
jgi:hypothetical protein